MKKMMIILLAATFAVSATAQEERRPDWENNHEEERTEYNGQSGSRNNGPYDNRYDNRHGNRNDNRYEFSRRELEIQISRINRDYDYKIRRIENDFFMSRYRKERIIRDLEQQRRFEIRKLQVRFNSSGNRYCEPPRRNW